MRENNIFKYIMISCFIIVIYLILDFLNVFNFITKEINFDVSAILVNAIVVVFVFLITYSLVNKKTFEREQEINNNKRNLLNILLQGTYKSCKDNLNILDNDKMLKKYIVPKVDFNSLNDRIIENLKCFPFQNERYIIELFSSGIAQHNTIKEYFEIKELYQKYVNMRITFFNINEHKNTIEHEELYNLLNTEENTLKNKLNNEIFLKEGENKSERAKRN